MNITKRHLATSIANKMNLSKEESKNLVDTFFLLHRKALKTKNIKISKFGSYIKYISPSRMGRNPKTMKEYKIPKTIKVSFKASNLVKKIFN